MKINVTKDYSIFKKYEGNRELDRFAVQSLESSMKASNLLFLNPIIVNASMQVIDGQHRLQAAKNLGLEVYYIIDQKVSSEDMILLNSHKTNWAREDYVNFYCEQGNPEYLWVRNKAKETGLSIYAVLTILRPKGIKSGTMKIDAVAIEDFDDVVHFLEDCQEILENSSLKFTGTMLPVKVIQALLEIYRAPGIDIDVFYDKLRNQTYSLSRQATARAYFDMFRDVYNWRNRRPLSMILRAPTKNEEE